MTLIPDLYQPRPIEVIAWDGTDQRATDVAEWIGSAFDVDTDSQVGHFWNANDRVVYDVPVGWNIRKRSEGDFVPVSPDELATKYQLVPVSAPVTVPGV